jgi:hypothetical protein
MRFVLVLLAIATSAAAQSPGSHLVAGMELVYASGGAENAPWIVEARRDTAVSGARCSIVSMKTNPVQPAERRFTCLSNDSLLVFDPGSLNLRLLRPVGSSMKAEVRGRVTVATYETAAAQADTVSGVVLQVIPTVVTTRDSTGRVLRRLRERFAVGLGTAVGGVFEVPDSTQASGWRVEREFALVRIVSPPATGH